MTYNSKVHKRRSVRLPGFDYSKPGTYFITICTKDRECLFGHVENDEMILNEAGKTANQCWLKIPEHYPDVVLHDHIVMPNHVHGIIELVQNVGVPHVGVQNSEPLHGEPLCEKLTPPKKHEYQKIIPRSIGSIVRGYKIGVVKWFRDNTDIHVPWQRNFHEHIIRNKEEYNKIAYYIKFNPSKWNEDMFFEK